jgi:hypothetical protein
VATKKQRLHHLIDEDVIFYYLHAGYSNRNTSEDNSEDKVMTAAYTKQRTFVALFFLVFLAALPAGSFKFS